MNIAFEKRKKIGRGINLGNALDFGDRPWDGGQLYTWVIQKKISPVCVMRVLTQYAYQLAGL